MNDRKKIIKRVSIYGPILGVIITLAAFWDHWRQGEVTDIASFVWVLFLSGVAGLVGSAVVVGVDLWLAGFFSGE